MTTTDSTADVPLSARFRDETRQAHERAENSPFMSELLGGRLDLAAWILLLEQYRYVYAAIEQTAARFRITEDAPVLLSQGLDRGSAIESDLVLLRARTGVVPAGRLPETAEYVDAILDAAEVFGRFIAHHYTRYLGDLSGGQAMRVMVDRHYGLPASEASFFRFEAIPKPPVFKDAYRSALDELRIDAIDAQSAVDEASIAFAANERMFEGVRRVHAERADAVPASA